MMGAAPPVSPAGDLGFSELTIAGLLGHSARGVTQRYVHLDTALAVAAHRVSARIAELPDGVRFGARKQGPYTMIHKALTERLAAVEAQKELASTTDFPTTA